MSDTNTFVTSYAPRGAAPAPHHQHGIALPIAMIMLLILTIIGVASMNTTNLEEKMAVNIQEHHQAFQAAESAIADALADIEDFLDVNQAKTTEDTVYGHATARVTTDFLGWATPRRGTGFSATRFRVANFELDTVATAAARARVEISQGLYQIVNKPQSE